MKIIDLSVDLRGEMPSWPGSIGFKHTWVKRLDEGSLSNDSILSCDIHIGTHVETPLHYIESGKSIDQISLELLCGEASVIELTAYKQIGREDLEKSGIPKGTERLLIKTGNSEQWKNDKFFHDFIALTEDAANFIIESKIKLIGIDYLSVGPYPDGSSVHKILLGAGIIVVEGLDMSAASPGGYDFYCLPLKIAGAEGAPARAMLKIPESDAPHLKGGAS